MASLMLVGIGQASAVPVFMCTEDSQCPDDQLCVDGACKLPCASDDDCGDDEHCVSGGDKDKMEPMPEPAPCPPDDEECEEETPEAPPEEASPSFCEPAPTSCNSDADCNDGEYCAFGPTSGSSAGSSGGLPADGEGSSGSGGSSPSPGSDEGDDDNAEEAPAMPISEAPEGICLPGSGGWESECETDEDCPVGMLCEELGIMETPIGAPSCICPEGEQDCDCGEEGDLPAGEPEAFYGCVPAPCDTDADCAGDFVCLTETWEECAPTMSSPPAPMMPDCDPDDPECKPGEGSDNDEGMGGSEGTPGGEGDCQTVTESYCVPPYLAPCEADADCGAGFSCVEEESCGCEDSATDSATSDPSEGPNSLPDEEPQDDDEGGTDDGEGRDSGESNCECVPTGEMICELEDLPCTEDADCEIEGWSCRLIPSMSACYFDEETNEEVCSDEETSEGQCVPPYWGGGGMGGFDSADMAASAEATGADDEAQGPQPGDANDEEETGTPTDSAAGDGSGDGNSGAPADGELDGDDADGDTEDEGGCQGGSSSHGGFIGLMLLAMAVLTRRERVTTAS